MTLHVYKPVTPAHDCRDGCWGIASHDHWNERTGHWYCPNGNDNCAAHPSSSTEGDR